MSFMQAQITEKQTWIMVDGDGVDYVPGNLVDVSRIRRLLRAEKLGEAFDLVADYVNTRSADQLIDMRVITGYGVRSSAPGYMDCTEWAVYGNKREAMRAAREEQAACDGSEDM